MLAIRGRNMKTVYRILVVLLIIGIVGLGVTAIIKSQSAIRDSDSIIKEADEFLRWCDTHRKETKWY